MLIWVTTRGGGYALAVETDHVDALRFVRLLDLAASAPDPATERDRLGDALQLWRGTPFDGVRSDWLERMQYPRLLERYLAAVERRIDLDLASGRDSTLVAELGELTARHPLRESLWVRLLVTLERAGRPAEALERYETIRIRLADELGADPGPALQQVHADLLGGTALRLPGAALPNLLLFRHGETITLAPPQPGVSPEHLSDQDQAMAWFTAEHPVLIALIDQTIRDGSHHSTCHLASALQVFLHRRGHWHARAATQRAALAAARRLGDRAAQARAHRSLGFASADLERYDDAHLHLDQVGQAIALSDVGWYHGRLGNHQQALAFCGQALTLHQELDNRAYQAHTWSCLGDTHHRLGDDPQAIDCYRHALDLFREIGDRHGEASALVELGERQQDAGDPAAARRSRQEAQAILDELDPPAAGQIRARFHDVDEPIVEAFVRPD